MTQKETIFKLNYPVEWDGQKVTEIKIARPKGKHVKKLDGATSLGDVMGIAHNITDYTDRFFDELDGEDYIAIGEVIGDFLVSGREDG